MSQLPTSNEQQPTPSNRTNPLALTSMILGIVSDVVTLTGCCCGLLYAVSTTLGIAAVVTGYMARSQIRARGGSGNGMATAGIICGFVAILAMILFVILVVVLGVVDINNVGGDLDIFDAEIPEIEDNIEIEGPGLIDLGPVEDIPVEKKADP